MDPYVDFLSDGSLPTDVKEAKKVQRMSSRFWLSEDKKLYQHLFGGPYLLCLHPSKTIEFLAELYEGICGGHSEGGGEGEITSLPSHYSGILVAKYATRCG